MGGSLELEVINVADSLDWKCPGLCAGCYATGKVMWHGGLFPATAKYLCILKDGTEKGIVHFIAENAEDKAETSKLFFCKNPRIRDKNNCRHLGKTDLGCLTEAVCYFNK